MRTAKKILCALAILAWCAGAEARMIDPAEALLVARHFLDSQDLSTPGLTNADIAPTPDGLAHVLRLAPWGYVVVAADDRLPPVPAFSWNTDFGALDASANPLLDLLQADLASRLAHLDQLTPQVVQARAEEWRRLLQDNVPGNDAPRDGERTDYWPHQGSTSTGGWVEAQWGQGAPHNMYVPRIPAGGARAVAGCPSVTMAQILSLHRNTRDTRFTSFDRYYHNYGGNRFWFDDDWQEYDFLSFPDLNTRLDSLDAHWAADSALTNEDMAALVFACGLAATQVYHTQGSGTFGVNQAFAAWQRFGYNQAQLLDEDDEAVYETLAQNMREGYPAHLAVVTPAWDAGHNVVVDGWNSDGYFHVNFGWNSVHDGWYLLPGELPYNLSVLEGVIVNLLPQETSLSAPRPERHALALHAWPNPCNPVLNLSFALPASAQVTLEVFNLLGQPVATVFTGTLGQGAHQLQWQPEVATGLYLARLSRQGQGEVAVRRVLVLK